MEIDEELEKRCKYYGTTLDSCTCPGFSFRKYCKHHTYLNNKEKFKIGKIKIKDGTNSITALKLFGEKEIDGLIHRGELYESKGKLFNLC